MGGWGTVVLLIVGATVAEGPGRLGAVPWLATARPAVDAYLASSAEGDCIVLYNV